MRLMLFVMALTAIVSLALELGFYHPPLPLPVLQGIQMLAVLAFVCERIVELGLSPNRGQFLKANWLDFSLILVGGFLFAVEQNVTHQPILKAGTVYVITMQGLFAARFAMGLVRFQILMTRSNIHPARIMIVSFAIVILVGGLLLTLPKASLPSVGGDKYYYFGDHLLNCLFTATSATCVTGLAVYDTGHDFTFFGQTVILLLIQAGGLGIMIFGSVVGLLAGRQLSLRESLVLQDAFSHETLGQIHGIVKFICASTFAIEAVGAAVLWTMWDEPGMTPGARAFYSVFHSVSAFCNAGFGLKPDSLTQYRNAWQIYVSIMPLIILGGIGFPVLNNLWEIGRRFVQRRSSGSPRAGTNQLSAHTRMVLLTTAFLIVVPSVMLFLYETPARFRGSNQVLLNNRPVANACPEAMAGMTVSERALAGLFQSVTTRTAGFNTARLDLESLTPASHLLMTLLMFIGGSPVSTAGGAKTVSIAILLLAVLAMMRRRQNVEFAHRTIPEELVRRAGVMVVAMFLLNSAIALVLSYTERASLTEVLFETVSACSTVGLSTGLTPRLTGIGKVMLIAGMFTGRLGPLTILIALLGRYRSARYEYPTEAIIIA
jgi:trk system potassium uptake protein